MAQVVPPLTSLPMDSTVAPSAEDIQNRLPSICVDYLSHDWQEEDVWASWRSMTRHKNEIANGVRLENASWRTWWKQRNKLRTISPETLNWLKDSDVTWLYGPLHTAVEAVPPPKVATTNERLGIVTAEGSVPTKPILKHRTLSEMLTIPMPSSPVLEGVNQDDAEVEDLDQRPLLMHTKSDTNIVRRNQSRRSSPPRNMIGSGGRTPMSDDSEDLRGQKASSPGEDSHTSKKHISFNTFVEQCIAVDDPADIPEIEEEYNMAEDEEDEDDMLEMRSISSTSSSRSSRATSRSSNQLRPTFSRTLSTDSQHVTIAKIAPTTLKALGVFPAPSPAVVFVPPSDYPMDQNDINGTGYHLPSPGSGNYDYPSPGMGAASSQWDDEDEDYSVGFDYFSGPDLGVGDEYNTRRGGAGARVVATHVGSGAHYGAQARSPNQYVPASSPNATPPSRNPQSPPTVGQAPPQPRWRIGGSASNSSGSPSPSSTSPNASVRASPSSKPLELDGAGGVGPAQPGRSILKIRPPGYVAPSTPESSSPHSTYFDFNPSPATGFGGLGQGVQRVTREPVGGSLPQYDVHTPDAYMGGAVHSPVNTTSYGTPQSPAMGEPEERERGRSKTVRPSTGSDRSTSRGTSSTSASSASVSPNAVRSPVQIPGGVSSGLMSPGAGANSNRITRSGDLNGRSYTPPQSSGLAASPEIATAQESKVDSDEMDQDHDPEDNDDKMDVDVDSPVEPQYVPERSNTPTPHSSPQVAIRPLKDTSAASLPHSTTPVPSKSGISPGKSGIPIPQTLPDSASTSTANLRRHHQRSPSLPTLNTAEPTMFRRSSGSNLDEEEGGTIMGRAATIANTAKDLLGALWSYGQQPTNGGNGAAPPATVAASKSQGM